MCYVGIPTLLLPEQISALDPANKVANLGLVTAVAVLLALVGNPLAGALSDRTSSRFGRRRPWIFGGALLSAVGLAVLMSAQSVVMIFIGWAIFQLCSNGLFAALTAVMPDQVPEEQRGTVSGLLGLATAIGSLLGVILIGYVIKVPGTSYLTLLVVLLVVTLPFALILKDKVLPKEYVKPFSLISFAKNFWINPRKHPDFGWAWLARFIPFLGYFMATGYLFYYLQDYVHYTTRFPGQTVASGVSTLTLVNTFGMLIFSVLGGILSDRFQRRKVFIYAAYVLMGLALLIMAFAPAWPLIIVGEVFLGSGFGLYMSVDVAMVTQVLPSAGDRGKDLGVINIANTLPQSLGPAVAAVIITATHSYLVLFAGGALIALISILCVRPIKSVR
jgi:MFS family permease